MIRRTLILMMLLFICVPVIALAESDDAITVYINGAELDASVAPQIIQSRTFVPIRVIAEEWGAVVGWNQERQQVRITKGRERIDLYIDQTEAIVNGAPLESDAAPVVLEGRTLIPLRFVGELLGAQVGYDPSTRTVTVVLPSENNGNSRHETEPELELAVLEAIELVNDTFVLHSSDPIQPSVFYLGNPERIVIDVPRAELNLDIRSAIFDPDTHQNIIPVDSGLIKSIRYAVHNRDEHLIRFVIDLTTKADYELDIDDSRRQMSLSMAPGIYKVVIDAGHGDHDPGASYFGRQEKEFNLQMAIKVQRLLEEVPRIEPIMTRTSDVFLELEERVQFAERNRADAFLSIHANAFPQRSNVRGTETYYTHDYQRAFADTMHQYLLQATGFPDRGLQENRFYVTRNTSMPAALLEVGFMSNPEEFGQLFDEAFQDQVAAALVAGMVDYFQL